MQSDNEGDLSISHSEVNTQEQQQQQIHSTVEETRKVSSQQEKRSFGHSHKKSGDLGDIEGLEDEDEEDGIEDVQGGIEESTNEVSLDEDAVPSTIDTIGSRGHKKVDSISAIPQKYHMERQIIQVNGYEEDNTSLPHSHFDSQNSSRHVSEIEDAGLDFVDVNLGGGGGADMSTSSSIGAGGGRSPYGPGAYAASRSAIEIRQDSISSDSVKAKQIAQVAEARDNLFSAHGRKKGSFDEVNLNQDGSSNYSLRRQSRSPDGLRRSVEGRYRGRLSTPTSPNDSPNLTPTREGLPNVQGFNHSIHEGGGGGGGIVMSFAGDDGDIDTVISPVTDTALPRLSIQEPEGEVKEITETEENVAVGEEKESGKESVEAAPTSASESTAAATIAVVTSSTDQEKDENVTTKPSIDNGVTKSPVLTDAADNKDKAGKTRRRESMNKPSALEQHLSRTRMTTLPPKPKTEDVKHLHDYEEMMKLSREMTLKRQQEEEERKNQKDISLQERMKVWESEILPSWTRARREVRLRKLWWKGVPPNLRGRVWALACGNSQMLPRNLLNQSSIEAKERLQSNTFPKEDLEAIEEDIERTLPTLRLFQKGTGPLYDDLFDVLCAFTIVRLQQKRTQNPAPAESSSSTLEEEGYVYPIGVASLAAMLLINLSPSEALIALINLIADRPWLRALYSLSATGNTRRSLILTNFHFDENKSPKSPTTPLSPKSTTKSAISTSGIGRKSYNSTAILAGFERVFDTLLADQMPKVYANMQARGVRPSAYVNEWIRTMFVPFLPFDAVARLWDCILLEESDALFFRTGIGLVHLLSSRLYVPDKDELISILRGNNRGALSVWNRLRTGSVDLTASNPSSSIIRQDEESKGEGEEGEEEEKSRDSDQISANGNANGKAEESIQSPSIYAPPQFVPVDDIYGGQYGITEDILFRTLEEQDSWWKDSVLERLLDRELVS